jgi:hypothetical protein
MPGAVTVREQPDFGQRPAYRNGYEHLAPLFAEHMPPCPRVTRTANGCAPS